MAEHAINLKNSLFHDLASNSGCYSALRKGSERAKAIEATLIESDARRGHDFIADQLLRLSDGPDT